MLDRKDISKAVLKRLPAYLSYLKNITDHASPNISATALAAALGMGEVQVRKDLAMVSRGGRPKVGYNRLSLIDDIEQFLGYDNTTDAVLIGAGKLGQALLDYKGFEAYGLNILAAFDAKPTAEHTESGDQLVSSGIKAIWNFANAHLEVPGNILVQYENMATSLAVLSMHLQAQIKEKK